MIEQEVDTTAVAAAAATLEREHRILHGLVARLREPSDVPAVLALLEELSDRLAEHFAREEAPGGVYDALGVCAAEFREPLAELVDEHYRLLGDVRALAARLREEQQRSHDAVHVAARRIADALSSHEAREHALIDAALGRK